MVHSVIRIPAILCLALLAVACGRKEPEQPASSTPPAAPAATAPAPKPAETATPPAQAAAPQETGAIDAGEQVDESEEQDTPIDQRANTQLAQAIAPPLPQAASRWKPNVNYQVLVPAQPTNAAPEKIEVMEIFWYGCSHCYALEPFVSNWDTKKRPANVQFRRMPVMWSAVHREHAKLYYILEALGRAQDLHSAVFKEVQDNHDMLVSSDPAETQRLQIAFFKRFGITEDQYRNAARSMGVDTSLRRAEEITRRYYDGRNGIDEEGGRREWGVPLLIVNGKYAGDVGSAGGRDELFALVNDLVALEKK